MKTSVYDFLEEGKPIPLDVNVNVNSGLREAWNELVEAVKERNLRITAQPCEVLKPEVLNWVRKKLPWLAAVIEETSKLSAGWWKAVDFLEIHKERKVTMFIRLEVFKGNDGKVYAATRRIECYENGVFEYDPPFITITVA